MNPYKKSELKINREHPDWPASAVVERFDGDFVFRFDDEMTDDQIWRAVSMAREAWVSGYASGAASVRNSIKRLIGIPLC